MDKGKPDIVVYSSYDQNEGTAPDDKRLSPRESLIRVLDLMDFMAAMNNTGGLRKITPFQGQS